MSFEQNIKRMFAEFDEGQKNWFRFEFADYLNEWVMGGFNGKQLSRNPQMIEDYLKENVSLSKVMRIGKLDNLLLALWCIRKCHGPIKAPALYRLTKIPDLAEGASTVRIRAKNSLKPVTSWTSTEDVVVHDRNPSDSDYIIALDHVEPKYVLSTMDIVFHFVDFVVKNADHFGLNQPIAWKNQKPQWNGKRATTAKESWKYAHKEIESYLDEKEFLIYLHPHEELVARVHRHVENPYKKKTSKVKKIVKPAPASVKKIKAIPPGLKIDNPFTNTIGGMDKFSPKQQYEMLKKIIDKTPKTKANHMQLIQMDKNLQHMVKYAQQNGIDLG